jgi:FkbM family methyltransferase
VLAFEPSAANFYVLTRNIQLSQVADRVTAYCVALSGETALGVLNLASAELGAALTQFGKAGEMSRYSERESRGALHGMLGFTVDEFIGRFAPPFPTHIKMDVDGLEWAILQGATAVLNDDRLRSIMVELSLTDRDERASAIGLLERAGFELVGQGAAQGAGREQAANHRFDRP